MNIQDANRVNLHRTVAQVKAIEAADAHLNKAGLPTFTELHTCILNFKSRLANFAGAEITAGRPNSELVALHSDLVILENFILKGTSAPANNKEIV